MAINGSPSSYRRGLGRTQRGIDPRHVGLVFKACSSCQNLDERVRAGGLPVVVEPKCRFPGQRLVHHTFVLIDPSDNWLEFEHGSHPEPILGCQDQAVVGDASL